MRLNTIVTRTARSIRTAACGVPPVLGTALALVACDANRPEPQAPDPGAENRIVATAPWMRSAAPAKPSPNKPQAGDDLRAQSERLLDDMDAMQEKMARDRHDLDRRRDEAIGRLSDAVAPVSPPSRQSSARRRGSGCGPLTDSIMRAADLPKLREYFTGVRRFSVRTDQKDELETCAGNGDGRARLILGALRASSPNSRYVEDLVLKGYLDAANQGEKLGAVAAFYWFQDQMRGDFDKLKTGSLANDYFTALEMHRLDSGRARRTYEAYQQDMAVLTSFCEGVKAEVARDGRSRSAAGRAELRALHSDTVNACQQRAGVNVIP